MENCLLEKVSSCQNMKNDKVTSYGLFWVRRQIKILMQKLRFCCNQSYDTFLAVSKAESFAFQCVFYTSRHCTVGSV